MTPRIAYLENGPVRDTVSGLPERFAKAGFAVERYWAFRSEFPDSLDGYAGVFLSGSPHGAYEKIPFIIDEHAFICRVAERRLPTLGVCFGCQILASALCGGDRVFRRQSCHVGYLPLTVTCEGKDAALTRNLPATFPLLVWHNDEIRAPHPELRLLATATAAPTQVWQYRDLPIWGIQGHPEVTPDNATAWLGRARERLERDGADVDRLASQIDSGLPGATMIDNFLATCHDAAT